jgi:two-component system chemotaxis sensor kinase CheA
MDIVRRVVVDELGGELRLDTTAGRGTTFLVRIPLSITIVDALSFRCGGQSFVVPVAAVEEIVDVDPARVTRAPAGKGRADLRILDRRGAAVPLVDLQAVFKLPAQAGGLRKAIVVRRADQPLAFEVDRMLGQQEVVVRPLLDELVKAPGVVGSTDLGDGQPTLVLDLHTLGASMTRRRTDVRT